MMMLLLLLTAPYPFADLEALERDRSWIEISIHLQDVPPASRDGKWRALAEKTLLALLEEASQADVLNGVGYSEAILELYPSLRSSTAVMDRRAELGIIAFTNCFEAGWSEQCGESLHAFVAKDPERTDLAFAAGKLTRRNMKSWYAVRFFRKAIGGSGPACADEDVHVSVMSALALPGSDPSLAPYVADGRAILRRCFPALRAQIEAAVGKAGYVRDNACEVVREQKEVGKITRRICGG